MSLFNLDFDKLVKLVLPMKIRRKTQLAWFAALAKPLKDLHLRFTAYRAKNLEHLAITSQVVLMEAVLNDTFDNVSRRIEIIDGIDTGPRFIYLRSENKPQYFYKRSENKPQYLYKRLETAGNFIVKVPTGLVFDTYEMRALVDRYRLPSMNQYKIVSF